MTSTTFYSRNRSRLTASIAVLLIGGFAWPAAGQNEIDGFMEQVLERRDENRITLEDYVLDEVETLEFLGPVGLPLQGFRREYTWYVREGYHVRSPVRFDGVAISEDERQAFETEWLSNERRRMARRGGRRRWSRRSTYDNVMRSVEREWGRRVSDDVGRALTSDADARGDGFAAVVVGGESILDDLGGIEAVGFGAVVARTRDVFVMVELDRVEDHEAVGLVMRMLPRFVGVLHTATDEELAALVELIELAVRSGLDVDHVDIELDAMHRVLTARELPAPVETLARARTADEVSVGSQATDATGEPASEQRLQPRFVSEAYFLDFEFEPGNYYVVGREVLAGREVVKIEYYPEQLFSDEDARVDSDDREDRVEAGFDKTSLVTLWVDPAEHQIVKFTFDNLGFDFLPGRWLVRLDDLVASMVMSQPFRGVWLPDTVELTGQMTLATGTYTIRYGRTFSNYRQAQVISRIRSDVAPPEPDR